MIYFICHKLRGTNKITHSIPTDDTPVVVKQYRYPLVHKEEIKQVNKLLEQDIILSSLSHSIHYGYKKKPMLMIINGDNKRRMKISNRFSFKLNDKTIGDAYPLPNITDILD